MSFLSHFLPVKNSRKRAKAISQPALFGYIFFLVALIATTSVIKIKLPGILGYASNINDSDLLKFTNEKRVQNGFKEVVINDNLSRAAEAKAKYMFEHNFWAHVAPDGTEPWDFIIGSGYDYMYAGENLAKDFQTSEGVVDAWMNSPSHKENLLNSNYDDIGLATVNGTLNGYETTLVVQMFGRKRGASQVAAVPEVAATQTNQTTEVPAEVEKEVTEEPAVVEEVKPIAPIAVIEEKIAPDETPVTLPAFDIYSFSKTISFVLALLIAGLFALDGYLASKRNEFRLSGHTFAHIAILVAALIGVWYVSVGTIL